MSTPPSCRTFRKPRRPACSQGLSLGSCNMPRAISKASEVVSGRSAGGFDRQPAPGHARTAWLVADLGAALRLFLQFADEEPRWEQCWKVLLGCIATQDEDQQSESPAQRFMALVGAAISSKRAHIGNARDPDARPADAGSFGWQRRTVGTGVGEREDWLPIGPCIGWTDGETVSLEPESAYALAQKLAMESGHALGVGPKTLWKRLDDADLIARKDEGRSTTKALIGSKRRRVLVIEVSILQESGQWGRSGHNGENPNEFYRLSRHDSHGSGDARIGARNRGGAPRSSGCAGRGIGGAESGRNT
jgi:hypothetical protein